MVFKNIVKKVSSQIKRVESDFVSIMVTSGPRCVFSGRPLAFSNFGHL